MSNVQFLRRRARRNALGAISIVALATLTAGAR